MLPGMIEIHDLDRSRKLFLRQVPNPFCAVSGDHFLLRPVPAPPLGLGVEAAGKLPCRFDRSRVGGAVFVSHRPAFGIPLGLREDTAELDFPRVRPSVVSFARPPLHFFAHHGHTRAIHLHILGSSTETGPPSIILFGPPPGESAPTSSAASVENCPC